MTTVAVLDMDLGPGRGPAHHPRLRGRVAVIDCYDLPHVDLDRYAGVIVAGGQIDQRWLSNTEPSCAATWMPAASSSSVAASTAPGCRARPFIPKQVTSHRDYAIRIVAHHPVLAGVEDGDLTLRRGVAGFFGRGHHPPPDGAQVLTAFHSGEPATYVYRDTTRGTILVQSTSDLLGYVNSATTAARIPTR